MDRWHRPDPLQRSDAGCGLAPVRVSTGGVGIEQCLDATLNARCGVVSVVVVASVGPNAVGAAILVRGVQQVVDHGVQRQHLGRVERVVVSETLSVSRAECR